MVKSHFQWRRSVSIQASSYMSYDFGNYKISNAEYNPINLVIESTIFIVILSCNEIDGRFEGNCVNYRVNKIQDKIGIENWYRGNTGVTGYYGFTIIGI